MAAVLDGAALDNPQYLPSVPITNSLPLTSTVTSHCLACSSEVGPCHHFSLASWRAVRFWSRGKGGTLKEEAVSLPASSPLLRAGFYRSAWCTQRQALAARAAPAGPSSSSTWHMVSPVPAPWAASPMLSSVLQLAVPRGRQLPQNLFRWLQREMLPMKHLPWTAFLSTSWAVLDKF